MIAFLKDTLKINDIPFCTLVSLYGILNHSLLFDQLNDVLFLHLSFYAFSEQPEFDQQDRLLFPGRSHFSLLEQSLTNSLSSCRRITRGFIILKPHCF